MNKYNKALQVREKNEELIQSFENQLSAERYRYSEGLRFEFVKLEKARRAFPEIVLKVGMSHGSYSSTSNHANDASEEAGKELAQTLSGLRKTIIERTVDRLNREIVSAAKEAEQEAKQMVKLASKDYETVRKESNEEERWFRI